MRQEEINIYTFEELTNEAKEAARNWYREVSSSDTFWSEYVINDAKSIAALMGIDIDQVYWSGFWSQGDGASFTGSYTYKKGAVKAVKSYAPQDQGLHRIAQELQDIQRPNFYRLMASISQRGHYQHENTMYVSVDRDGDYASDETTDQLLDIFRQYAQWIYSRLEAEYEYQNSDEVIDEALIANEYEFTTDGERY